MFKFRNLKMRPKLITLYLLIAFIPLLCIAAVSSLPANRESNNQAISKLAIFSSQKKNVLSKWVRQEIATAKILASSKDIYQNLASFYAPKGETPWDKTGETLVRRFLESAKEKTDYDELFVTDTQGLIINASNNMLLNNNLSSLEYIKVALSGESGISPIFHSEFLGENVMAVAVPIYSESTKGKILGVFGFLLNAKSIGRELLNGIDIIGKPADAYLINQDKILLTVPRYGEKKDVLKTAVNIPGIDELVTAIREYEQGFAKQFSGIDNNGEPVITDLSVFTIGNQSFGLVMTYQSSEAFGKLPGSQKTMAIFLFAIVLAVAFTVFRLIWSIVSPVQSLAGKLGEIATGDLTVNINDKGIDELGEMARGLNAITKNLATFVNQVIESTDRVHASAQQITVGNQDLSQRTQEQASTLEQIAATIEEINISLKETVTNSQLADETSLKTLQEVKAGEKSIQETSAAMAQISASSKQIAEIIKVVNDIAFQTNLLALNASVEAARAGEQGRGFAVVAAEVRNLAGRTGESAREIEHLIKESVARVEKGNTLVQQSALMLQQIVENTRRTSDVVKEVAVALNEQKIAADQIQTSIEQLNHVTQQNAAMVEEMAASSESLNSEAEILAKIIRKFDSQEHAVPVQKKAQSQDYNKTVNNASPPEKRKQNSSDDVGDSWEKF